MKHTYRSPNFIVDLLLTENTEISVINFITYTYGGKTYIVAIAIYEHEHTHTHLVDIAHTRKMGHKKESGWSVCNMG